MGLGKPVRNHNGNRKMAGLIVQYRRQYNESKNGQKGAIVEEILGILSTDGGRFLRRYNEDSTWWTEVPQQVAFKKVCDAFRSQGKIAKAEAERRNEKIQDDKRAKKAEVVAERKEKKRKRVEEKEQKVSQCNTNYCSECLCIICIILQSVLYSNPYYIIFFCFYCCCCYCFQETRRSGGSEGREKKKSRRKRTKGNSM